MSFSDLTFLFYFLPLFFAVYCILPFRFKNAALVLGSFAFYFIGAGARDTLLLSGVLLLHYALARAMAGKEVRTRKALLIIALAADLFCLVYFKYAAFILENLGKLTGTAYRIGIMNICAGGHTQENSSYYIYYFFHFWLFYKVILHLGYLPKE